MPTAKKAAKKSGKDGKPVEARACCGWRRKEISIKRTCEAPSGTIMTTSHYFSPTKHTR